MKFPIGFSFGDDSKKVEMEPLVPQTAAPVKCMAQVYFPERHQTLTYFNDQFDLKQGDFVFVDGKLENERGVVRSIRKNFKIKVADYKRVIGVADTNVSGQLHMAGPHFVSFDPAVLPYEKIRSWFLPPVKAEDEYESGNDDSSFSLDKLDEMGATYIIFERGRDYYAEGRVAYISIEDGHGRAIVVGEHPYELEFDYSERQIRNLTCSCPCGYTCKHEVAAMLQLKDILEKLEKNYPDMHQNYFAAVEKLALFRFVIQLKESGSLVL